MQTKIEYSSVDNSVNFIEQFGDSYIEFRYVRRSPNQVIAYLSSFNGCDLSCRFCHLTATGQTGTTPVSFDLFKYQLSEILKYWNDNDKTGEETTININFMARGEPLNNPVFKNDFQALNAALTAICKTYGLEAKINISTIIPKGTNVITLYKLISKNVRVYWSLYSPSMDFRKQWLPKAMLPNAAAQMINNYRSYGGNVVLHSAFIKDQNDSDIRIQELIDFIEYNSMDDLDFNIIAYNPHDDRHGEETERKTEIFEQLSKYMKGRVQIIDRIGPDVHASCGMFFE